MVVANFIKRITLWRRLPLKFFLLVFALSLPFWLVGAFIQSDLLPGVPLAGLSVLSPVTAALICVYQERKLAGIKKLLKRSFDFDRIKLKIWYVPLLLMMPCIMFLSYIIITLSGVNIPTPQFSVITTLLLFIGLFTAALFEELGWSGYAIDPLQNHFGAFWGAIILGVIWAVFHLVPLLEVHRSPGFIAWWSLGTVSSRVIVTWLYNNTGKSVFAATIYHTMSNLTWQLFPVHGSYYDPRITSLITLAIAVIVVILWNSRTLTRFKDPNVETKK